MGITMWVGAGILGRGGLGQHTDDDAPLTRGDKFALAILALCVLAAVAGAVIVAWVMLTAPPQDNSWCLRWVSGHCAERRP